MKDKPEYSGAMTNTLNLSGDARTKLAGILSVSVDSNNLKSMENALVAAAELQSILDRDDERKASLTELKSSLEQLRGALGRADKILEDMNGTDEELLDQYYYLANGRDRTAMDLSAGPSGFAHMVNSLNNAVIYYEGKLQSPGKGKRPDKTYSAGIGQLAEAFASQFPNRKLSKDRGSVFYNVVAFWFELIGAGNISPTSHIHTALSNNQPHV